MYEREDSYVVYSPMAAQKRNTRAEPNYTRHLLMCACVQTKPHRMRVHFKHSNKQCSHAVCLVVTRPGAASTKRGFPMTLHSDPHVVYACLHDVWKSFTMCTSRVHVCMHEDSDIHMCVQANKMNALSIHACIYCNTRHVHTRDTQRRVGCRLALLNVPTMSGAAGCAK
jgi:hypothetical protein